MRKILFVFLSFFLILSFVSALSFDNVQKFNKDIGKYGKYEITNAFGMGKELATLELKKNTDTCGQYCSAEKEIVLYEKGSLVDNVIFETILDDGSRIEEPIRNYQFYIKTEGEQVLVDDYETQCHNGKYNELNKSYEEICEKVKVGSHYEDSPQWTEYSLGDEVEAGTYTIKLEGEKKPSRSVDWIVESNGIWTTDWALWGKENFIDSLVFYYGLDESSGDVIDSNNEINATNNGATTGETGILNTAYDFDGSNDYLTSLASQTFNDVTVSFWLDWDDIGTADLEFITEDATSGQLMIHSGGGAGINGIRFALETSGGEYLDTPGILTAGWNHIVITYDGTTAKIYKNGTLANSTTIDFLPTTVSNISIGVRAGSSYFLDGTLDELAVWSKALNSTQVSELYNSGLGLGYDSFTGGSITLNSPADDYISNTNEVTFNATASITGGATLVNMSLWTNESGSWEAKNTKELFSDEGDLHAYFTLDDNEASTNVLDSNNQHNGSLLGGDNTEDISTTGVIGNAFDLNGVDDYVGTSAINLGTGNFSVSGWFKPDSLSGTEYLWNFDYDQLNSVLLFRENANLFFLFKQGGAGSAVDTTYDMTTEWQFITLTRYGGNVSVYINDSLVHTEIVAEGGTLINEEFYLGFAPTRALADSYFNGKIDEVGVWDIVLSDTEISQLYNSGDGLRSSVSSSTETFTRTITEPTLWSIQACDSDGDCGFATENRTIFIDSEPPSILVEYPNGTLDYGAGGASETFNVTFTDSNLDSCWYDYNGTNITIDGCVSGVKNSTTFILEEGNYNMTIYANDSVGNVNSSFIEWDYKVFENSQTYSATTYGTEYEEFILNITYSPSDFSLAAASLVYNGTSYTSTRTGSGGTAIFSKTIQIPTSAAVVNNSFYWNISLTNGTGTYYFNSDSLNQTVSPIVLSICGGAYTTQTLNFTIKEAGTFDLLNSSLEATFNYWGGGSGSVYQTYSYSNLSDNSTSYQFCISPSTAEFVTDATISYLKDGYDRREYFLDEYSINNQSENITLYLSSTDSTDIFTFYVQDEDLNPVSGAYVRVQRWDIGTDNFYTVGMIKTTADGTGIINMRLNDAWYRYQVLYGGTLYLTTEPVKESSTSRVLDIVLSAANPYDAFGDIEYTLTYNNETNTTIFDYADTTGAVQVGCLKVLKLSGNSTTQVYYSCVESTSGTLSYEITDDGDYIIQGIFRLTSEYGSVEQIVEEIIRKGTAERFITIGSFGQVISLLLTGTAAMIGVAAGSIILGFALIVSTLILENLFGWLNIGSTVLYALISIVIVIALNLKRKGG